MNFDVFFTKNICFTSQNIVFLKINVFCFCLRDSFGLGQARPGPWAGLREIPIWLGSHGLGEGEASSQSASVGSQAQPTNRRRWMASQSAFQPAMDPCVDYLDHLIDSPQGLHGSPPWIS